MDYVVERRNFLGLDDKIGQREADRFRREKLLKQLIDDEMKSTVFARSLIPSRPFFCDLSRQRISLRLPDTVETALGRIVRRELAFVSKAPLQIHVLHDLGVRVTAEEFLADNFVYFRVPFGQGTDGAYRTRDGLASYYWRG